MPALLRRALPTIATIRSACAASCTGVSTTGSCSCTSPITTPFGDLFNPPSPLMVRLPPQRVIDSSPGAPIDARALEVLASMIASVSRYGAAFHR